MKNKNESLKFFRPPLPPKVQTKKQAGFEVPHPNWGWIGVGSGMGRGWVGFGLWFRFRLGWIRIGFLKNQTLGVWGGWWLVDMVHNCHAQLNSKQVRPYFGPGGLCAPCMLACAMHNLAIVITIVWSSFLSPSFAFDPLRGISCV